MKIQDALDLHLKEEASRIIGDAVTGYGRRCGGADHEALCSRARECATGCF